MSRGDLEKVEKEKKTTVTNRCPNGFVFGKDTDVDKLCDSCSIWDECLDEKEKK